MKPTYYNKALSLVFILLLSLMTLGMTYPETLNNKKEIMARMEDYTGKWKSDTKTNRQNGSKFHWIYELSTFNTDTTIYKMIIIQRFENGKESLWWEGYKGWNPVKDEMYYYGFSPSGRFSEGTVSIEEEKLVTKYTGYGPEGATVHIVDEFFPVENGKFKSITNLKPVGGDWRVIGKDEWTKL